MISMHWKNKNFQGYGFSKVAATVVCLLEKVIYEDAR